MTTIGLTSGEEFLIRAVRKFFEDHYENPVIHLHKQLHRDLAWTPALRFTIHEHVNVFVEPSETSPYPHILKLKLAEVFHFPQPIAIYVVCPEDMISKTAQQRVDRKHLQNHGFGLITVDSHGQAQRMFSASPLIHVIPRAEFKREIAGLRVKIRQRVSEAFDDYHSNTASGVSALSEVIEGLVEQAGNDALKKEYLVKNSLRNGIAKTLDALYDADRFKDVRAAIGGVRSYIKEYRNLSHHWPKNEKKAYQKYAECRHAFLEGIKKIQQFSEAMRSVGLSGKLPRG